MVKISEIICEGYEKFWADKHKFRVMKGGKGSAKSSTTALNLVNRIMKYAESNLLVVRNVYGTHRDSTFAQLKWAIEKLGVSQYWKCTVSPMEMKYLPTGQKIIFRGFDDVLKLASTTVEKGYLCWVWVEEAFEIATEDDFEKLELSVARSDVPFPLFNQFTITFNPWSETHWLKSRFFDKSSDLVSTYTTTYKQNRFLGADYVKSLEEMRENNYRKYSVAGLGEWGIAEGLVFENWQVGVPMIGDDEKWKWRDFYGLDYGYKNDPSAFIAFKVNPIDRRIYIYDEFYRTGMLNCDLAATIKRKGYAKERIRADCAEPKSNDDLKRLGIGRILPSEKGRDSILNGIDEISGYKIFIDPACKNALMEISTYVYDEKKTVNGHRIPVDTNNHLCDALRYGFYDVRFFHPVDPKQKRRLSSEERYNRQNNISVSDINNFEY